LKAIVEAVESAGLFFDLSGMNQPYIEEALRVIPQKKATRYVKIAEGCNKNCSYCVIPSVRGRLRSRSIEAVVSEVQGLVEDGAKEIILIAQDTTRFGADWAGRPQLAQLLAALDALHGRFWIRVFYMYPEGITDDVLQVFEGASHLLPYFDLPVQHANDKVLKEMNRASDQESIECLVDTIRRRLPDAIVRTTFIVGFPGETEAEFEDLNAFISRVPFDKVGVFPYSIEEGTPAAARLDQVAETTKLSRKDRLMKTQMAVSAERTSRWLFQEMDVIIEERDVQGQVLIARGWIDAPEIDGIVVLPFREDVKVGDWARVRIVETNEYDMKGEYR
jgi:ribosomal protein S12 methylthiotransferase